jgi:alkylated DNA repair dioxygenase AlkB
MADELGVLCDQHFNAVLLNYYRNGQDSMGWHRDNEPEIIGKTIASVSLGSARAFKIRHRDSKKTYTVELPAGSLLLMTGLQKDYEHSLPKRAGNDESRINLTFRLLRE